MAVIFIFVQFMGFRHGYSGNDALRNHVNTSRLYYAPNYNQASNEWNDLSPRIKDSGKSIIFYHDDYTDNNQPKKYIVAESTPTHSLANMHNVNTNNWEKYDIEKSKANFE